MDRRTMWGLSHTHCRNMIVALDNEACAPDGEEY
jgi:hypothetical protein